MSTILTHVVLKILRQGSEKRLPGELVDTRYWSLTEKLVEQRYIAPVPPGAVPVQTTDGRWWLDSSGPTREKLQIVRPITKAPVVSEVAYLEPAGAEPEELEPLEAEDKTDNQEYPVHTGGGYFTLSDGSRLKGKQAAIDAEALLGS